MFGASQMPGACVVRLRRGISRRELGEFSQIDPAVHAMLGGPVERGGLILYDLAVPVGALRHSEQNRAGIAEFLQRIVAEWGE